MSAVDAVLRGRVAAEALMVDACVVHRPGALITDPDSGAVTRSQEVVYEDKCKLQQTLAQSRNTVAGEHKFTVQDIRWDTPVGSGPFRVDDIVTVTSAELDNQLVGRQFRVAGRFNKSAATAQRIRVEEVVG